MKQYYNLFLSFTLLLIASACEDGFDIDDVEIANGYALSAGTYLREFIESVRL